MRRIQVESNPYCKDHPFVWNVLHFLLVDLIPMVLLLTMMAYGMVIISDKLEEPRSVEIATAVEKLS